MQLSLFAPPPAPPPTRGRAWQTPPPCQAALTRRLQGEPAAKQFSLFDAPALDSQGREWSVGQTIDYKGTVWTVAEVGRRYIVVTNSAGLVDAWIVEEHCLVSEREGRPLSIALRTGES